MNPVVLHVVRPYATEEQFLEEEAWTIDARGMLLVDQAPLPIEAAVVFDVSLTTGAKLIRAEARVAGHLEPSADRPGGMRVRFRRFGSQTKAFIDRALEAREEQLARAASSLPPSASAPPPPAEPPASATRHSAPPPAPPPTELSANDAAEAPPSSGDQCERSGIHQRPRGPIAAPANRDELLTRLRQRAADQPIAVRELVVRNAKR